MKKRSFPLLMVLLLILAWSWEGPVANQAMAAGSGAAVEIESRPVNIWSDGTRLSGDLWKPKGMKPGEKRPALILCHGWGGVRSHLNQTYAPAFARAGYIVLTFDYRGWGDSDSRLVIKGKMPAPDEDGEVTVKALAIRELVDPFDQTEDIIHCIDFLSGEPDVDPGRIGLWGTSFGGGHVLYVAAQDDRIRCIVSQVPAMDGSWAKSFSKNQAVRRARGEIAPVPQTGSIGKLRGTPYMSRIANYRPIDFAGRLKVPMLIIVAENSWIMPPMAKEFTTSSRIACRLNMKYFRGLISRSMKGVLRRQPGKPLSGLIDICRRLFKLKKRSHLKCANYS